MTKYLANYELLAPPIKVGLVGTGYVAKRRAEALVSDGRSHLSFVAGHRPEHTQAFAATYQVNVLESWQELVHHPDIDLVIVCTINRDHEEIAAAALLAGKHAIVEYPLASNHSAAEKILTLAREKKRLLHVEHIELLGGLHQAIKQHLGEIGPVFYARYVTVSLQDPAPLGWTYNKQEFGFPLTAALSRIHRFTDLFGAVEHVSCDLRYWDASEPDYFTACLCNAHLKYGNGLLADITYGKGEIFSQSERRFEVHGEKGSLIFAGEQGQLVKSEQAMDLDVGSRRGLFVQDTGMVLDALIEGKPLYINPEESNYSLKIANAAAQSIQTGQTVAIQQLRD